MFLTGCGTEEQEARRLADALASSGAISLLPTELKPYAGPSAQASPTVRVLREEASGPVIVVFPGPAEEVANPNFGLSGALDRAMEGTPCSAALFGFNADEAAYRWVKERARMHDRGFVGMPVILAGYGYGGEAAGTLAWRLLEDPDGPVIHLLLTVDAIKRIPGGLRSLVAYTHAPPVDRRRLLRHTNYFQNQSSLAHGAWMRGATENHDLTRLWPRVLSHATIDNYAASLAAADIRSALHATVRVGGTIKTAAGETGL
ncbi:MAG: hypothetical protein V1918_05470 [Planctomycetota bacterium]